MGPGGYRRRQTGAWVDAFDTTRMGLSIWPWSRRSTLITGAVNVARILDSFRRSKPEHCQRSFSPVSTSSRLPRSR